MGTISNRFVNEGWERESASGTVNGSNLVFTITYTPDDPKNVEVYVDGLICQPTTHYTISGSTITFQSGCAPELGQTVFVVYSKRV